MLPVYHVAFDLSAEPLLPSPAIFIPLALTCVGAALVFQPDLMRQVMPGGLQGPARRIFSWVFFLFTGLLTVAFAVVPYVQGQKLREAEMSGDTRVAEGCLQAFHPMPATGHDMERLRLDGQTFTYSDFVLVPGFHQSQASGGPIHADSRLRLTHVGPNIVRVEVADHACPAAPDWSATSTMG